MSAVLVLNNSSEPLHVCDWRRAVALIVKNRAEVVEHNGKMLAEDFPLPLVIRLSNQVFVPYSPISPNRHNIFARDRQTCQYCGGKGMELTLDHVIPRSKGGPDSWENLVTACHKCNGRKGDQSLSESGMTLLAKPVRPRNRMAFFIMKHRSKGGAYECWSRYLQTA
ncbi:MAG: HNH endonuclease [Candidatus Melainabacteria bacterium]|nr:HNH endonuclease [Candidatus Melainabacteria bacterium]